MGASENIAIFFALLLLSLVLCSLMIRAPRSRRLLMVVLWTMVSSALAAGVLAVVMLSGYYRPEAWPHLVGELGAQIVSSPIVWFAGAVFLGALIAVRRAQPDAGD